MCDAGGGKKPDPKAEVPVQAETPVQSGANSVNYSANDMLRRRGSRSQSFSTEQLGQANTSGKTLLGQ